MKRKTMSEKTLNVKLDEDTRKGLSIVSDDKGRADCRQAAQYIKDGVKRDLAKKAVRK